MPPIRTGSSAAPDQLKRGKVLGRLRGRASRLPVSAGRPPRPGEDPRGGRRAGPSPSVAGLRADPLPTSGPGVPKVGSPHWRRGVWETGLALHLREPGSPAPGVAVSGPVRGCGRVGRLTNPRSPPRPLCPARRGSSYPTRRVFGVRRPLPARGL